jgi:putative FmdB family regulatory protein
MPVYEYKCKCSQDDVVSFERGIFEDEPEYACKKCGSELDRHFGTFGVQFKGNGFYKTDNSK